LACSQKIHPLNTYLVHMLVGIGLGAFVAAAFGKDLRSEIQRGPRISPGKRLALALIGGALGRLCAHGWPGAA